MSKNYKVWCYTEEKCSPCEKMKPYPAESAAAKGYEFEEVVLVRTEDGNDWIGKPIPDFFATPFYMLENLDDNSILDSFYGGNKPRFDILINK
jgi:hypothetical protein